jgi:predicted lipoprotein with Yx(FWY)xxD motif
MRLLNTSVKATSVVLGAVLVFTAAACGDSGSNKSAAAPPPAAAADAGSLDLVAGTAKANDAPAGTGDFALTGGGVTPPDKVADAEKWVQLTAGKVGKLSPGTFNGAHLTLYVFDNDKPGSGTSACTGDCAKKWPPVEVAAKGKIFVAGITGKVGFFKRDGAFQVTVDGKPVYRFAQDTKPGDTKGQGVGGTWFVMEPDGGRNTKSASTGTGSADDPQVIDNSGSSGGGSPSAGSGTVDNGAAAGTGSAAGAGKAATSAIFFDDKDFSDDGAAQGVTETGGQTCQDLPRPGVASSLSALGSLKIWTEKGCKGKSMLVDGDVSDLSKIGFDDAVQSVRFLA